LEYRDKDGYTALLIAATYGHADTIHSLLGRGADYEAVEKNDKTAVYLACEEDNAEALSVSIYSVIIFEVLIYTGQRVVLTKKQFSPTLSFSVSARQFSSDFFTIIKGCRTNPSYKFLSNFIVKYR
jgi:serine protease inhibitor